MKKKIIILKNDRIGDLFASLKAINCILNNHKENDITIFLSNINHKFGFLFSKVKKRIFSSNLSLYEKIKIFYYFTLNKIDSAYILTPKNFYYYLPFFFRKTKFYGITIKSKRNRPNRFLKKYLYKEVTLDRVNIKKRFTSCSALLQESLVKEDLNYNFLINTNHILSHNFSLPQNYVFFHYKHDLFARLLGWDFKKIKEFLFFLKIKYECLLFSSELNNNLANNFFYDNFNSYNFKNHKINKINNNNIFFLKEIEGYDLFDVVRNSKKIIAPEGIMTQMGYFLNKSVFALLHFNLRNRQDFINQIISCKEWFPPNNYKYAVLKKDFYKSIKKIEKRI